MIVTFNINYFTNEDESVCIVGSDNTLGNNDNTKAISLSKSDKNYWTKTIEINTKNEFLYYKYLIKRKDEIIRIEEGEYHQVPILENTELYIRDIWKDKVPYQFIFTSAFSDSFAYHPLLEDKLDGNNTKLILQVINPYIYKDQEIRIVGNNDNLGNWNPKLGVKLSPISKDTWQVCLTNEMLYDGQEFKFIIYDTNRDEVICWEDGENRIHSKHEQTTLITTFFRSKFTSWKAAGVAIPIFSLRSKTSFGIGDFSDLKKLVDWVFLTSQRIIQILPINDSTITKTWKDSYPYNALSVFALHPIYLGLSDYPLNDSGLNDKYLNEAKILNDLESLDYEKVLELKSSYIDKLYIQEKEKTESSEDYKIFKDKNQEWLFPYACFCYLRDKIGTADYTQWESYKTYDLNLLTPLYSNNSVKEHIDKIFFTQYLLHKQLSDVKKYANEQGVILKGDIPIGISRMSVEAWMHPELFNLDMQTGAPPDDFAKEGQNWGFPTYNWQRMSEDSYHWWRLRFQKMADYFDAYRIDHILGFFRIWEIPISSVQGLLGQFNPSLPLSQQEIGTYQLELDPALYSSPFIYAEDLDEISGIYNIEIKKFLQDGTIEGTYILRKEYQSQYLLESYFGYEEKNQKNSDLKNILFSICNEVLFVKDNSDPYKYHPRISLQETYLYKHLSKEQQDKLNSLYDNFYFHRHNEFWKMEAMKKLPTLIHATNMLVCGEDLGMIPSCVPDVMNELQILSLEIQRMPKILGIKYSDLSRLPYLSVCSTSTHDMSPIRLWWTEDKNNTQYYYNQVLHREGDAPKDCTIEVAELILKEHLDSSSMLAIFPIQDWLSISQNLRNPNIANERINIPADPNNYWRYRMNIYIEDLIAEDAFNTSLDKLISISGRR